MTASVASRLRSEWIRVGDHRIHTRRSHHGTGTSDRLPVVLVHGLVISSLYMVPTAERLAADHPLFAPDLPGFGRSSKPASVLTVAEHADVLLRWMRRLGLEEAVLVGNSFGCQVIAEAAIRAPRLVGAAVLAGPTMDPAARTAPAQIGRWLLDWTMERPSLAMDHLRDYRRAGLVRAWRTFRLALDDRIEERLPRIDAPTLVVRGARDPIVPQSWAEQAAALLPRGELAVIPGAPHVVNYTTPEPFVRLVREFVGRVAVASCGQRHAPRSPDGRR